MARMTTPDTSALVDSVSYSLVSFPSWELFERQSKEYQLSVFPDGVPVLSVEASSVHGTSTTASL
jgi:transketolase